MVGQKGRDDGHRDEVDADTHTGADAEANTDGAQTEAQTEAQTAGYAVGHRRPPKTTRFSKGASGNPRGRPKGRKTDLPHEAVLGRHMTIRKDGRELQVTAEEAFLLQIGKAGIDGDGPAARATLALLEGVRAKQAEEAPRGPTVISIVGVAPGSVTTALEALRMARRLDAYRDSARILLELWIVEAGLQRLGSRRLSEAEQKVVFAATRTPHKVNWPSWWGVKV
jgi:hypothetical protein